MEKSRKDYAQLTEEDNKLLLSILAKLGARMYQIYANQKSPKELASKWLREIKTKKVRARIFILFKMEFDFEKPLSPADLNTLITENLADTPEHVGGELSRNTPLYLNLNRMSELLTPLELGGLFSHILGKEKLEQLVKQLPEKEGGPYSFYIFSTEVKQLPILLSKPEALQTIIAGLDNSNLLYKAMKYLTKAFFYLLRDISEEELYNAFRSLIKDNNENILSVTKDLINQKATLLKFSDFQLEKHAEWQLRRNLQGILKDESKFLARVFQLLAIGKQ